VIEIADTIGIQVTQRPVSAAELRDADEVFATSTAGGIMPIRSIDGRELRNAPGPVTRQLADTYWKKREEGWRSTPVKTRVDISAAK